MMNWAFISQHVNPDKNGAVSDGSFMIMKRREVQYPSNTRGLHILNRETFEEIRENLAKLGNIKGFIIQILTVWHWKNAFLGTVCRDNLKKTGSGNSGKTEFHHDRWTTAGRTLRLLRCLNQRSFEGVRNESR